jgi:hypothetical protein
VGVFRQPRFDGFLMALLAHIAIPERRPGKSTSRQRLLISIEDGWRLAWQSDWDDEHQPCDACLN